MPILINNHPIESFNFPGGECHVNVKNALLSDGYYNNTVIVKAYLYNSDDLVSLLLTVDAIRRIKPLIKITLIIPYFPYARQDRVCNAGEALSVKVMAYLINGLKCAQVEIYDPHSDVVGALINNCKITNSFALVRGRLIDLLNSNNVGLLSPDQGAEKRVREFAKTFKKSIIYANKIRNPSNGKIVNTKINITNGEIQDGILDIDLLIIDDICDGGRTFIEIAKVLRQIGFCRQLYLYVTHGIFSKGLEPLKEYFTKIFCYHTFLPIDKIDSDFLEIIGDKHAN